MFIRDVLQEMCLNLQPHVLFPNDMANLVNLLVRHEKRASNIWCGAKEPQGGGSWSWSHIEGKNFTPFVSKQTFSYSHELEIGLIV